MNTAKVHEPDLPHALDDAAFMSAALALGRRALGLAAPNPAVGALVVKDSTVVGRGWTGRGGRPHAERLALAMAGEQARGATLYVTLEPCSHHGATPPCVDAIIAARIARVVSAIEDPDPRVSGRGHARLRTAGIVVETGVGAETARRAHLGHILRVTAGRPMVTLKLAETADGFAAGGEHDPRLAITGLTANGQVQVLRAMHDAIMVGIGTAETDDPLMTVRLPGLDDYNPLRVVLDTHLRLPLRGRLLATARRHPTLAFCSPDASASAEEALHRAGVVVVHLPLDAEGHVDLLAALPALAEREITRVLSEGGPRVAARLIESGLADAVVLFTSPKPFGRPGVAALSDLARSRLGDPARYVLAEEGFAGDDRMRRYERVL